MDHIVIVTELGGFSPAVVRNYRPRLLSAKSLTIRPVFAALEAFGVVPNGDGGELREACVFWMDVVFGDAHRGARGASPRDIVQTVVEVWVKSTRERT